MDEQVMIVISFLFFMCLFAGVGMASIFVKKDTTDDYLVAGRGMHPALAALSAVSTWNSGYMFIGFIGFTFMTGYNVLWLGLVSTIGQIFAWAWLYKFIQKEGQERGVRSLSSLVAEKAGAPEAKLAAILSVLFLCIYAAAQLTSGGKALLVMMGWSEVTGILIGFVLVVAYCYAGGIRASIWTDAIQSCVMIVGSVILCWIALDHVGGFSGLNSGLEAQSPTLTSIWPPDLKFGISLWAFAFFLGGLGVAGQPQVVSRVMTLGTDKDRKQAMIWFFVWQTPFIVLMLIIGLACRVLFNEDGFDAELGLPTMAMETMPAIGVGMILASIFAATMSTADSQVLACTAAITDDIKPEWREDHMTTKKVTIVVAIVATAISIAGLYVPGGDSVFALVVLAVYGLGGIFIPLLTIRWMGYKPDSTHSITMMVAAFVGVIGWTMIPPLLGFDPVNGADGIFPSVPGMGAAFLAHFLMCTFREESDSKFLANIEIPKPMLNQGLVALVVIFLISEVAYLTVSPDSSESEMGGVGNYTALINESRITVISDEIYVNDGDELEIFYTWEDLDIAEGFQPIAIDLVWIYDETDEATDPNGPIEQASCLANPGENVPDTTTGTFIHGDYSDSVIEEDGPVFLGVGLVSQEFNAGLGWLVKETGLLFGDDWDNDTKAWNFTDISEKNIHENLSANGEHPGDYSMSIRVDAETGGNSGCPHSDEGEEIEYRVQVRFMKFEILPTEEVFPSANSST
ncbi:MAG: hypothetical protein CMA03_02180 [Euryarchaeota archaeon]|nr:hypothetical protein [Euryarchaeota archaeon]